MAVLYYLISIFVFLSLLSRWTRYWRVFFILITASTILLIFDVKLLPNWLNLIVSLVLILITAVLTHNASRLFFLRYPLSKFVNNTKVAISDTELAAIESGDTHWEQSLFTNQLDWQQLFSVATPKLSAEEQAFINNKVPELCELFLKQGMSEALLNKIKADGYWAMVIPKKYGGLEFSAYGHAKVLTLLSSCDISLAVTVMVPNSLGPGELIQHYGTEEQKNHILPKLASGEEVPCFALTSTFAGSDAGAMIDSGVIGYGLYKGEEVLGITLNWDKRYTTLAPIATLIGLAFKTYDPDHLLSTEDYLGISCALVDASLPGITIGRYHHPMGVNFANGPHQGEGVFIPLSAVIGGKKMIGKGWRMLMEALSHGRGISLPSLSIAGCQLSLKTSLEYSSVRHQFHQPLYRFQGISERILPMAAASYQMQAMSAFNLALLDQGWNPSVLSAMLKYHHTEALRTHLNAAMDIHGGKAIMLGDKNYLSFAYESIPIAITVEGANILTRSMIIFGQGLLRCHPFLQAEIQHIEAKDVAKLNDILGEHIGHGIVSASRSLMFALTSGRLVSVSSEGNMSKVTKPYYRKLAAISASFAFLTEVALLRYGTALKFQETLSGLFSDLLINLYALSSTLKYYDEQTQQAESEAHKLLLHWIAQTQLHDAQQLLLQLTQKLPLWRLLKWLVLPRGLNQARPDLKQQNKLIQALTSEQAFKASLTEGVVSLPESHALTQLEQAYKFSLQAEPILKRIKQLTSSAQIKQLLKEEIINDGEAELLEALLISKTRVEAVDDYEYAPEKN